ncbi:MAG TPA: erythromycin esterase family protein [Allosphingosinicella sp.]|nr:erythromycin esterase family protein [Allosphingosinicella sp.]
MRPPLTLLAAAFLAVFPEPAAAHAPNPLDPASAVERAIGPGEVYEASLRLRRGESADIVALQQGIDLVVDLFAPDGALLQSVDSPNGRNGDEPVAILAAADGDYRLLIRPIAANEPRGRFTLRVAELRDRAATERLAAERRRARAEASDWLRPRSAPLPVTGILPDDLPLAPFDALAGEALVVGLGEATHGSRELNDLRLSLVRRLVERHGFRLIALEDSASRWRDLAAYVAGEAAAPPAGAELEWGWIGRRARHSLLLWARRWNLAHPGDRIAIVGVDPQDSGPARERFASFLERAYGAEVAASWAPAAAELAAADEQTWVFGNSDVSAPVRRLVLEAYARVQGDSPLLAQRFGEAATSDAVATARELLQFADFNGGVVAPARSRDWYMAVNLLAATGSSASPPKAIYWAHNAHVSTAATGWGPTGAVLRQALGCGYRAVASTFGEGAFVAQRAGDAENRLLVAALPAGEEETIESVVAGTGPGARLAAWPCEAAAGPAPWLREPRPLRWIGGLYAPDTPPAGSYRPYRLTEAFDAIAYLPAVAAEDVPPDRPAVPARPRPQPPSGE